MRIQSKFKDFYDFVVIETDNRKFYDRTTYTVVFEKDHYFNPEKNVLSPMSGRQLPDSHYEPLVVGMLGTVAFCDKLYVYFHHEDKIYWKYEDVPVEIIKKNTLKRRKKYRRKGKINWFWGKRYDLKDFFLEEKKLGLYIDPDTNEVGASAMNKIFNCPIVFIQNYSQYLGGIKLNPCLSDIGFNKVLSATQVYQEIYNWIPFIEPVMPSDPTDMSRYEGKGFDKKTSFRPNMKDQN